MSFFRNPFKKSPKGDAPPVTVTNSNTAGPSSSVAQSMDLVYDTVDKIDARIRVIEKQKDGHVEDAKKHISKKEQDKAKACLIKKKQCEEQILGLMRKKDNLIQVQFSMENQILDSEIHDVLVILRRQMQEMQKRIGDPEDVEEELDQLREAMENAHAVSAAIGAPLTMEQYGAEEEAEAEMALLEQQMKEEEARKAGADTVKVPSHELPNNSKNIEPIAEPEEEEETEEQIFARLEAEATA